MSIPLCENCKRRPARLVWTLEDGALSYACGKCGRPGSGVSLRELESGEVAGAVDPTPAIPEWSTTAEVAARHKLSAKTIRRAIASGSLKASGSKHRPYRISRKAEQDWIEARREGPTRTARKRNASKASGTTFRDMARE
jgi:hypothetical protein